MALGKSRQPDPPRPPGRAFMGGRALAVAMVCVVTAFTAAPLWDAVFRPNRAWGQAISPPAQNLLPDAPATEPPAKSPNTLATEAGCDIQALIRDSRWPIPLKEPLENLRHFYLTGLCLHKQGRYQQAFVQFQKGLEADPRLEALWLPAMLESAYKAGWQPQTAELAERIAGSSSQVARRKLAGFLAATRPANAASQQELERLELLGGWAAKTEPAVEDYALFEELYQLAVKYKDTRWALLGPEILWSIPKDSKTAEDWVDAVRKQSHKGLPPPAPALYLKRAARLYSLGRHVVLQDELRFAHMEKLTKKEAQAMGRLYFRSVLALKDFNRMRNEIPQPYLQKRFQLSKDELLPLLAHGYIQRNKFEEATGLIEKLEEMPGAQSALPGLYLALANRYEVRDNRPEALAWSNRLLERFPADFNASQAHWNLLWNHYSKGQFDQAAQAAQTALNGPANMGVEESSRFYYWLGRAHQALNQEDKAAQAFQSLKETYPASYYGLLARNISLLEPVRPLFAQPRPQPQNGYPPLNALWNQAELRQAFFYYVMEEERLAEEKLAAVMGRPLPQPVLDEMFQLFVHFGQPFQQQRLIANYYTSRLKQSPVNQAPLWRYAYPQAYWDLVEHNTYGTRMNPYFVLAIMREESHFKAQVDSAAGARGLMQLMLPTAKEAARGKAIRVTEQTLYLPQVNIPLGVSYLEDLRKKFEGKPLLMAAAYNAGPNAVNRWVKNFGNLPADEFVENIPYPETRRYVQKVFASYIIYSMLYDTRWLGQMEATADHQKSQAEAQSQQPQSRQTQSQAAPQVEGQSAPLQAKTP